MKIFHGNYDGKRRALVKAKSQKAAAEAMRCSVHHVREFFQVLPPGASVQAPENMKPDTIYTTPYDAHPDVWVEGRCALPARNVVTASVSPQCPPAEQPAPMRLCKSHGPYNAKECPECATVERLAEGLKYPVTGEYLSETLTQIRQSLGETIYRTPFHALPIEARHPYELLAQVLNRAIKGEQLHYTKSENADS